MGSRGSETEDARRALLSMRRRLTPQNTPGNCFFEALKWPPETPLFDSGTNQGSGLGTGTGFFH